MTHKNKLVTALILATAGIATNNSHAVGLQLMPGSPNFGTAGAGHAASGMGAGSAWANPATMTLLEGQNIGFGAIYAESDIQFSASDESDESGGNAGGSQWIPSFAYSNAISDSLSLGMSVVVPFGSAIDYDEDWAGKNVATDTQMSTVQAMPSLAYRINDQWSLGFGITANQTHVEQNLMMQLGRKQFEIGLEADGMAYGWTMGTLYEINDHHRIGVVYRSQVDTDLTGEGTLEGEAYDAELNWENPASLMISGYHDITDEFSLLWDIGTTYYSAFETTNVTIDDSPIPGLDTLELHRNWQDAQRYALGGHYALNDALTLQAGYSLDESPVSTADRSVDMPIDDIERYALGALYKVNDTVDLSFSVEYADMGSAKTQTNDDPMFASPAGEFDTSVIATSFSLNYQF